MENIQKKKTKGAFLRPRDKVLALLYFVIASLITLFENKMGMALWDAILFTGIGILSETLLILLGIVEFVQANLYKVFKENIKKKVLKENIKNNVLKENIKVLKEKIKSPHYWAYTTSLLLLFYVPFLLRVWVFYSLERMSVTLVIWFCILNLLVMFGLGGLFTTVSKWFQYHLIVTARKLNIPL